MSQLLDPLNQSRQEIITYLNLDIDQFLEDLNHQGRSPLTDCQKWIIFRSLLGDKPTEIAQIEQTSFNLKSLKNENDISMPVRNELRKIYPLIRELFQSEDDLKDWLKILNLLLKSARYKLTPPLLNDNHFQSSFGNQLFLISHYPEILAQRSRGVDFYQKGLYYQAFECFKNAWILEKDRFNQGNPETLIYLNNSWLDHHQEILPKKQINVYTIAIVIPVYHNFGRVAKELLRGIAQLQLMVNLQIDATEFADALSLGKNLGIQEYYVTLFAQNAQNKMGLKILIVNENNNLYAEDNQTAKYLANIAKDLNIMAVIGHYSSEMTKKAVKVYADQGLLLITPSSTSNQLSSLNDQSSLFRMTTADAIAAQRIIHYLADRFQQHSPLISILYNENSIYSCSLRESIRKLSVNYPQLHFVDETEDCPYIHEDYHRVKDYLNQHSDSEVLIVIPDGGIEPNSLKNSGLITHFSQNRLIIGSATLYHENLFDGLEVANSDAFHPHIVACVPWHYQSHSQGANSQNSLAQKFCQMANQLWEVEQVTWRSATSFDSGLMVIQSLARTPTTNPQKLLENINLFYRQQGKYENGVTGEIKFGANCDRLNAPTELVTITWQKSQKKWRFVPISC